MLTSFDKLIRILLLEEKTGCSNRSVIGGLDRFASYWKVEALSQVISDAQRPLIEKVAKSLEEYPTIEEPDARRALIQEIIQQLRAADAAPATPSTPSPPASKPTLGKPVAQPLIGHAYSPAAGGAPAPTETTPAMPALHKPVCKRPSETADPVQPPATPLPQGESATTAVNAEPPAPLSEDELAEHERTMEVASDDGCACETDAGAAETAGLTVISSDEIELDEEGAGRVISHPSPPRAKPSGWGGISSGRHTVWARQANAGLDSPVTCLPSVGDTHAQRLSKLGIRTIWDLLYLFPRRYDDYSRLRNIRQLQVGEEVTVIANVTRATVRPLGPGRSIVKCTLSDGTGTLEVTWFNQPFLASRLQAAGQIVVSGLVQQYLGRPTMTAPEWEPLDKELIHTGRLAPVYPLTEGVTNRWLRRLIKRAVDYWAERIPDHLPEKSRARRQLPTLGWALQEIHFPSSQATLAEARRRLIFDEFLLLQLSVLRQRHTWRAQTGQAIAIDRPALEQFIASLPYALTAAQQRALDHILNDLAQPTPMNRLLQGDVGSGKTIVAACAALAVIQAGYQAAVMAPTEILAEQHAQKLTQLFAGVIVHDPAGERPLQVRLLTGSARPAEREAILSELAAGAADLVIGTHALIQEDVHFARLALVVVDEQHRFGVRQRAALRQKGYHPHLLSMTATPIPRTLSLTLFGDMDVAVIDELPPGRQPIQTYLVTALERERAYRFVRKQVNQGHQAFIVCPLIDESEKIDAKAAVAEYEHLQKTVFPDLRLGLLHGRMRTDEKEEVMRRFVAGELHILVSTAVVEVGIDVPNATVMLVEGAERFGLAQLHQFRGRVGRGAAPAYCLLVSESAGEDGLERLRAVAESQDGFALAEMDLKLRGPGEFFGTRQSGLPDLRLAQLADVRYLESARAEAELILAEDSSLQSPEHQALRKQAEALWSRTTDLS